FGEVDFYACKNAGIDIVCPVDNNGHFTSEVPEYAKMFVKDADKQIIHFLKEQNAVFHAGQILHRYPYCWRSDTPLIYRAMTTWFVAVEKIKEELIQSNEQIEWVPDHIKHGRFGKWLENARDWAISRNRYWGTPIPLWRSEDGDILVIGSVKELEEKTGKTIDNLHRHHIDDLVIHHNGKEYKRITEVFDCWFESGSMPYAQNHYPFENKELTEEGFPADFIAEGLDQTRGWFYTLTVIATALFKKPAFKNVIVNGILLAEDGNKMSKRLKNYPDPEEVIHEYGADAIRLYLLHSPAVKAEDLRFSKKGVELTIRKSIIPFWNAFYFLSTYAKIYDWKPTSKKLMPKADIDRWILSKTQKVIEEVTCALDRYDLPLAIDPILAFIEQITNWYIRRSRSRFWSEVASDDREEAFGTLYYVIKTLSKILAPFIPFVSETIYSQLRMESDPISVHLCDYPQVDEEYLDKTLEREMDLVQRAVSIGHSLRKEQKIKVRQPLQKAHVMAANVEDLKVLEQQASLIQEELNVKEIEFKKDASAFVQLIAKPNFPVLGKRFGKMVPQIQKAVQSLSQECLENFLKTNQLNLEINGESIDLSIDEVNVERKVKEGVAAGHDEDLALAIDTQLSPELIEEGLAREIVNKLNTMRRDQGFEVTDRIHVLIDSTEKVQACYKNYKQYIDHEVLIVSLAFQVNDGSEWNLNGEKAIIQIKKA
ncbi:MAG TPA: class I tRNA ligase family protein, partial [Chlamydiales bacterium]|nr:class I tRNA ligase family protein [Chlamydiales bacterium]